MEIDIRAGRTTEPNLDASQDTNPIGLCAPAACCPVQGAYRAPRQRPGPEAANTDVVHHGLAEGQSYRIRPTCAPTDQDLLVMAAEVLGRTALLRPHSAGQPESGSAQRDRRRALARAQSLDQVVRRA